jgi:ketosteroid isomerase-like protein
MQPSIESHASAISSRRETMAHPNEELLRKAYADFAKGDLEGYLSACVPDFAFNVPGRSVVAGRVQGRDQFLGMVQNVMQQSGGQFQEEVEAVLANDEHGVVLAKHRFPRNGKTWEYQTAHVYRISNGKLVECWEQPRDPVAFDAAWAKG